MIRIPAGLARKTASYRIAMRRSAASAATQRARSRRISAKIRTALAATNPSPLIVWTQLSWDAFPNSARAARSLSRIQTVAATP